MNRILTSACAALFLATAPTSQAAEPVRLGVIADMSGPYVDLVGPGFVTAVTMAAEDFGGAVLDRPIEVLSADDQTKADIASAKVREWFDTEGVEVVFEGSNSASAVAIQRLGAEKRKLTILFSGTTTLTNENCSPFGIQYAWDTYSLSNGTARAIMQSGGDTWFFITADYVFGKSMESDAAAVVESSNGEVLGRVRHPINSHDFSAYLLTAQQSGSKVLALANAGKDTQSSLRQAVEFGLAEKQKIVPLLVFDTDIRSMGLDVTQGISYTTAFYWDFNDKTREFSKRFFDRHGSMPTMNQAGAYSATMHYLRSVAAAGTQDPSTVIKQMKDTKINDFFAEGGFIREDGRMVHDMYLVEVKKPSESSAPWDIAKVVQVIPGEEAFAPLSKSTCAYLKQ